MPTVQNISILPSIKTLLEGVVDYAGLFPPASLSMPEVVNNYSHYVNSRHSGMLGRLIIPAAQLEEFTACKKQLPLNSNDFSQWHLSVLCGTNPDQDFSTIGIFKKELGLLQCIIDAVELKVSTPDEVRRTAPLFPQPIEKFFEIPIERDPLPFLVAIHESNGCAKVRTGGVVPEMFPKTSNLARFIIECVGHNVQFKATAGLHHPIRSSYRLTYEPDSQKATMYGFLNVLIATAFAHAGCDSFEIECILEEQSPDAFQIHDDRIVWNGKQIILKEIVSMRRHGFVSFGSCSFREPIEDLHSLHLL